MLTCDPSSNTGAGALGESWKDKVIRPDEIDRYLVDGHDFIDDELIDRQLERNARPDPARIQVRERLCILWLPLEQQGDRAPGPQFR